MELTCISCGAPLVVRSPLDGNYMWQCYASEDEEILRARCIAPKLDTSVSSSEDIAPFQDCVFRNGILGFSFLIESRDELLPAPLIPGAKVYMPHIVYHFVRCLWPACYLTLYRKVLVPHLDCPAVLDYVLRSNAIYQSPDMVTGRSGARIYAELHHYLRGVSSCAIQDYLQTEFG